MNEPGQHRDGTSPQGDGPEAVDAEALQHAREHERLHRALQDHGAENPEKPPAQQERDDAVDAAIEDVEAGSVDSGES